MNPTNRFSPPNRLSPSIARMAAAVTGVGAILLLAACQSGASALPSVPAVPSVALPSSLPQAFVQFEPQGGSDLNGGAVLSDSSGQTTVVIGVVGGDMSMAMPAILFAGDCTTGPTPTAAASEAPSASAESSAPAASAEASGATGSAEASSAASAAPSTPASEAPSSLTGAQFQLEDVSGGTSTSTVPISVSELTATPYAIAILSPAGAPAASASTESMAPESGAPASGAAASAAPASAAAGSSAAASAEPSAPAAPSASAATGASTMLACGEVTNVQPSGMPSLLPGGSAPAESSGSSPAPSGSTGSQESLTPSMTEPSPSS